MRNIILKTIWAIVVVFGIATNDAKAEIDNPQNAKAGEIYRWETNNPNYYDQLCEPDNGVYGLYTFAADQADWDSQFFLVFADAVVPSGTKIHIKFDYRKGEGGAVSFKAQGYADPYSYVNNDGWNTLDCSYEWNTYDDTFLTNGEIRSFGLNCSIAREDGILLLRNIVVEVNGEVAIRTKETDSDAPDDFGVFDNRQDGFLYTINNGVASIVGYSHNDSIADIIIPAKTTYDFCEYAVTSISSYAFEVCSNLKSVVVPNSVTNIHSGAFADCNNLTSITIPNSVKKIGSGAFSGCSNLESVVISNSVTSIGNELFRGCASLTSITIPNTVSIIGDEAFSGCSKLESVTIPDSVTEIGRAAFSNCNHLESITFGSSVEKIGRCVFTGCNSLKNIVCKGLIPPKVDYDLLNYVLLTDNIVSDANLYMNATLTCPENAKWYRTLQPWCNFDLGNGGNGVMDTVFVYDTVYQIVSNKDTVYFADNNEKHKVTATSANTKMGIAYGSGMFAKGSQTEIVAIEKYGYHFTKWSDGNTGNPRFVDVTKDGTFTAEFEVNNYWVLAEANEKVMGKVEGAAEYAYLSRTQLKATPNAGYQFKEWSDGETDNPREILVYSDTTFTAVFEEMAGTETSVAESAADAVNIYVAGKNIVVENATDEILVYNAMGALVCRDAINRVPTELRVNIAGVYIVKTGAIVKRVVVN
ncbi:MAG: leucine-rich repeat protein [Salinivirgaceae bacterium]|nr:leucine-rich repeat protein [Salinivirgaceae bacterium]